MWYYYATPTVPTGAATRSDPIHTSIRALLNPPAPLRHIPVDMPDSNLDQSVSVAGGLRQIGSVGNGSAAGSSKPSAASKNSKVDLCAWTAARAL